MARLPDLPSDTALSQLFFNEQVEGDATWFSLPGGGVLFEPGEAADQLYFLRAGRLGAFRRDEGQEPEFLGVIRPGEPAGEMSLLDEGGPAVQEGDHWAPMGDDDNEWVQV